jgi:hypothetical protein
VLPSAQRAQIANRLDSRSVVVADDADWDQVLHWALSVRPTSRVVDNLATDLNHEAIDLAPGSAALSRLSQARSINPHDAIIVANWAGASAQLDIANGVTTNFSEYTQLLEAGMKTASGPSNYQEIINEMARYQLELDGG